MVTYYFPLMGQYFTNNGFRGYDWTALNPDGLGFEDRAYSESLLLKLKGDYAKKLVTLDVPSGATYRQIPNSEYYNDSRASGGSSSFVVVYPTPPVVEPPYVPPTTTPPPGGDIGTPTDERKNTFIIEIPLGNQTFAKALKDSGDFYNQVNTLCEHTGYKLTKIGNVYNGEIWIEVVKIGSWNVVKLVGAIIAIIGIVLVAIFSGSVVVASIAVVGGYFALHFVVRSLLTQEIVTEGTKIQDAAIEDLKGLLDEVRNDPTLTDEQKAALIQDIYGKISDTLEAIGKDPLPDLPPGLPGTNPPTDGGGAPGLFDKVEDILLIALVFFVLIMLFQATRKGK